MSFWRREPLKPWVEPSTIEEKRALYACGKRYITLDRIPTWPEYIKQHVDEMATLSQPPPKALVQLTSKIVPRSELNSKISLFRGDMTTLEIDAVVNAANESLLGGGGIDGCIHSAAGPYLRQYNSTLGGCDVGQTKISPGFKLPAKYVLSTVGPRGENAQLLQSSYETVLDLVLQHGLKTVGFCCVSTGIFGYPLGNATLVALSTMRKWLETDDNYKKIDRLIFVVFLETEQKMYEAMLPYFFPEAASEEASASEVLSSSEEEVKSDEKEQDEPQQQQQQQSEEQEATGEPMEMSQV